MNNILDYLKWRGDLTFKQSPFNSIDSLILARAAYFRWELVFENEASYTFQEAYERFTLKDLSATHMLADEDPELFRLLSVSERFKNCVVSDFINEISLVDELQFCALTIHLDKTMHYVAYRGTDNTLVGWKEDLNMSFQDSVMAQKRSLIYLKEIAKKYTGKIRLGGHSKGGNLAVYSSLFTLKSIQKRILTADNFDGPGLSQKLYEKVKDHENYQKVRIYYPQSSIIGRLLYQKEIDPTLIQSSKKSIYQHDLYSWQILGKEFICVSQFDKQSEVLEGAISEFLEKVTPQQRKECIDIIFELLLSTNEMTFHDFSTNWLKNSGTLLKSVSKVDAQERKVVLDSFKTLMNFIFDELKSGGNEENK